ncbi:PTTG1IP family member 2 [Acomys russatus]|uniref:PTTG1IP family member 2 n=1 Tax=Acomys russatus TaxID=60746 RepID=UPI0021E322BF|nr:PTTG1IP family member 2 [Acomys russatus]
MCWLRAWRQIFLPVFLSLALIQLINSFSDHKFTETHHHWRRKLEGKYVEKECAQKQTCPLCTQDKRCIWCREERVCKKYCFPYSDCSFNSIFWANCRVDMFGIMMLILVAILVIGFLSYCLSYYLYMQEYPAFYQARGGPIPGYNWNAPGKCFRLFDRRP